MNLETPLWQWMERKAYEDQDRSVAPTPMAAAMVQVPRATMAVTPRRGRIQVR